MDKVQPGADVFFLLMGAILVFAMHGGFAFLEVGTVRKKNQVNALCKILVDFAISTVVYFFIGYGIAYGVNFLMNAKDIAGGAEGFAGQGLSLVKFFFLCTFAAAIPAIISGGIAERANSCRNARPRHCLLASATLCLKALSGTATSAYRPASSKASSVPNSMISQALSSSMGSVDGQLLPPSWCSVRGKAGTPRTAAQLVFRRPQFPGSHLAHGCYVSAGSAST